MANALQQKFGADVESAMTSIARYAVSNEYPQITQALRSLGGIVSDLKAALTDFPWQNIPTPVLERLANVMETTAKALTDKEKLTAPNSSDWFNYRSVQIQSFVPLLTFIRSWNPRIADDVSDVARRVSELEDVNSELVSARENLASLTQDAELHFNNLLTLETDTKALASSKTGAILNSEFDSRARQERSRARLWTIAAWTFALTLLITFGAFVYAYIGGVLTGTEPNWGLIASKILFATTLGFITKWCSKRANRHLLEESKYHRLAVNLAAVNPFIAQRLDSVGQQRVITEVALRTFTDGTGTDFDAGFESSNVGELVGSVGNLLKSKTG